jgi:hypothetical protein
LAVIQCSKQSLRQVKFKFLSVRERQAQACGAERALSATKINILPIKTYPQSYQHLVDN